MVYAKVLNCSCNLYHYPICSPTACSNFVSQDPSDELFKLKRCAEAAKDIAVKANAAKREAENSRRTHDLQKRLDTKEFDRSTIAGDKCLKNLDLRRHRLVYDGSLVWRLSRNKAVDLHVVLLEDFLVLLTKNSDGKKLSLKYHSFSISTGKEDVKYTHCPILKLNSLIAKSVATDTRAFFVVKTSSHGPQIYEFVSQTSSEKKKWIKFLSEQIDISKAKEPSVQQGASNKQKTSVLQPKNENIVVSTVPSMDVKTLKLKDTEPTISDEENPESGVERAEIKSQPKLINPSEVMIQKPTILEKAQPVLTPLETLKRNDEVIINCLTEKLRILTDMFKYSTIEELQGLPEALLQHGRDDKEAKELVLAAIVQTNRILEAINSGMKTDQEFDVSAQSYKTKLSGSPELPAVSCVTLTRIAAPLIKHLTALLHSLQKMDEDLKRMQNELYRCKGLIVSNFASTGGGEPNSRSPRKGILVNEKFRTSPNRAVSMAVPNSVTTDVDDYARNHCLQTKEPYNFLDCC
uniref:PH domain-containing protein n=1 Tax=Romanomermis culicivorax TaxID=13658 RepID=A0A915IDX7_ROMCU